MNIQKGTDMTIDDKEHPLHTLLSQLDYEASSLPATYGTYREYKLYRQKIKLEHKQALSRQWTEDAIDAANRELANERSRKQANQNHQTLIDDVALTIAQTDEPITEEWLVANTELGERQAMWYAIGYNAAKETK